MFYILSTLEGPMSPLTQEKLKLNDKKIHNLNTNKYTWNTLNAQEKSYY